MIVALAGGVGGAKLAHGLYASLDTGALTVVVNTADDFDLYGLRIMPDADTVLYTLAGVANPDTGWGVAGDTFESLAMLKRYGEDTWFWLGDRDLATHILRTQRLREGWTPTRVLASFAQALGVRATLRRCAMSRWRPTCARRRVSWRSRTTSYAAITPTRCSPYASRASSRRWCPTP